VTRLLWVDDQSDVARTLSNDLTEHQIEFATSGGEAISLLTDRFYDLVLLDLSMPPGMWGGLWVLGEMIVRGVFTPVIVLSGEGTQTETIKAIRLGARDYVTKETAPRELRARVQHALQQAALQVDGIGRRPTADLIAGAETRTVEFKETARWNVRRGMRDPEIEREVIKTVLGLLNAAGGTLLVGIRDDGEVIGLAPDLALFASKRDSRDSLTNWLTTILTQAAGAAITAQVRIRFEPAGAGHELCRIDVPASSHPVFDAGQDDEAFFVRFENSTRRLTPREAVEYVRSRWPGA